ncbi:efflux RND transporter permease subunit [Thiomicrorhabdus xiamenensis]|uniref:Efflux RND transporter permease subunit n=1 Tax=Thiomicrorhabdus xiamenensis TaxID=2739063 RepID=A0A7D4NQH3_9GAMM|nr:efflux RND transporter permease subunit [Thiomicrorhabdus xiamenensis]QKI88837.1 efflux RND transporter permease subunit [Thiomicrorhabdus xiamenensis]
MSLIDAVFNRSRVILLTFIMLIVAGAYAYLSIPKESSPDVPIPIFIVSMVHDGISPEDAERLLIKPMEKELQSLDGLKEMTATAAENYGSILLEFSAGADIDQALLDVREKVDLAKANLPPDTLEPTVNEINVALFPVISLSLSGPLPEREMVRLAQDLKDELESLSGVLEVEIGGDREEMMEVIIEPETLETYHLSFDEVVSFLSRNNQLVPAGAMDTGSGRMVFKVPGVIENIQDVLELPIKTHQGTVVTFSDLAQVRRTYKDPDGFARVGGEPALVLEVTKRVGANIIETIDQVKAVVAEKKKGWPEALSVHFMQDQSEQIKTLLGDLENNVLTAIFLVMLVIIAALGIKPAVLVGLAIPGAFLSGILALQSMDYTLNIIVLFSLILSVGMLVDGAIVTVELAQRKMAEGMAPKEAYAYGAKRMAWPIIASTATTLSVFFPLLFWPGVVGEFMKFLPITVILTLLASLLMALIFIPVLGSVVSSKADKMPVKSTSEEPEDVAKDLQVQGHAVGRWTKLYVKVITPLLSHPKKVLLIATLFMAASYVAYAQFGKGVEFFPEVEPDFIQVQVQARGDLSVYEKDELLKRVEAAILDIPVYKTLYAKTYNDASQLHNVPVDLIGIIQLELRDWQERPTADEVIQDIRQRLALLPGIQAQVRKQDNGPSSGKPIQVELSAADFASLRSGVEEVRQRMTEIGGFIDIEDSRPIPGIEWHLRVDREQAARYQVDIATLGNTIQMLTTGIKIASYQPDDAEEELDIRLRFPEQERNLEQMMNLKIPTAYGPVPLSNFAEFHPRQKTSLIERINGQRVMSVQSDVPPGFQVDQQLNQLKQSLQDKPLQSDVAIRFKGQDEDQKEAADFLMKAFVSALFLMVVILVTQFNSFYQAGVILTAIVFSTAGVLLGLLITQNPFGVVMVGIGVIALAGIVVNNNIVLIDTYNQYRLEGMDKIAAIQLTLSQRMRPVLLTTTTTILGLMPMVLAMTIDIPGQSIAFGAPSSQWWVQLSSAIVGGLTFSTLLTLIVTPCLLALKK